MELELLTGNGDGARSGSDLSQAGTGRPGGLR